jgi:hypothetical protein
LSVPETERTVPYPYPCLSPCLSVNQPLPPSHLCPLLNQSRNRIRFKTNGIGDNPWLNTPYLLTLDQHIILVVQSTGLGATIPVLSGVKRVKSEEVGSLDLGRKIRRKRRKRRIERIRRKRYVDDLFDLDGGFV